MCEHVGSSLVLLFHGFKIPDPKLWTSFDICSTHLSQFPFPDFFLSLAYLDETNYESGLQGECLTNTTWNVLYFKDMLCIHDSHVYLQCCSWWPKLGKSLLWVESEMSLSDSCAWAPGPQLVVRFRRLWNFITGPSLVIASHCGQLLNHALLLSFWVPLFFLTCQDVKKLLLSWKGNPSFHVFLSRWTGITWSYEAH